MVTGSFVIKSAAISSGVLVSIVNVLMCIIAGFTSGKQRVLKCADNWRAPSQALVGRNNQCLMYINQFLNSKVSRSG